MRERKIIILTLVFFSILISKCNAQLSVGVSPPLIDLGEIQPGASKIGRFNVITVSKEISIVRLSASKGNIDYFMNKYGDLGYNYSEEDISSWVEFISNPVKLEKSSESSTTKGGGKISGASEVIFILHVPKDAEPGYHSGLIDLYPIIPESSRPITIQSISPLIFIFKVPGKALREGKIMDLSSGSYYPGRLNLNVYFKNTGTVTIQLKPAKINVFGDDNKTIASLTSDSSFVKPGEIKRLTAFWPMKEVKIGTYNVTARIDYTTGYAFKKSIVEVYKPPIIPGRVVEKPSVFPWWILIIFFLILLIGYIFYKSR